MKNVLLMAVVLLLSTICRVAHTQNPAIVFDTIRLIKADPQTEVYSISDSILQSVRIQASAPVQMKEVNFKFGGDMLRGALTLVTGIGMGNSQPVDWYLPAIIRTNNTRLDWISDWYCPGYIEKERTRVTAADGSKSVETEYYEFFSWERGALGYIIEQGDTIGWHYTSLYPRGDTLFSDIRDIAYKGQSWQKPAKRSEFALWGEFSGVDSYLILNADENQLYIFRGYDLVAIFHDTKPPQTVLFKRKKPYAQPYVLIDRQLTGQERLDIIRLTLVGKRMKRLIAAY